MTYFYILFLFLSLAACNTAQRKYELEIIFKNRDIQVQGYNASIIEKRFLYQGATIDEAKRINDSTIDVTITTSMDTSLMRNLVEKKGELLLAASVNYKDMEIYMERVYTKAITLGLIPKVEDDFARQEFIDFSIFLERPTGNDSPVIALADPNNISFVEAVLQQEEIKSIFPDDIDLKWTLNTNYEGKFQLLAIRKCRSRSCVTNDWIKKAIWSKEDEGEKYTLNLDLRSEYISPFANITTVNFNKSMPVIVDDKVILYPVINRTIENGQLSISGLSSLDAFSITTYLNGGKLNGNVKMYYRNENSKNRVADLANEKKRG